MLAKQPYTAKTDIYSLTIVCWEILTAGRPYAGIPKEQFKQALLQEHIRPEIPQDTPVVFQRLLESGWATDPRERPTANQMLAQLQVMLSDEALTNSLKEAREAREAKANHGQGLRKKLKSCLSNPNLRSLSVASLASLTNYGNNDDKRVTFAASVVGQDTIPKPDSESDLSISSISDDNLDPLPRNFTFENLNQLN